MTRIFAFALIFTAILGSGNITASALPSLAQQSNPSPRETVKTLVAREWRGRVPVARADEYYRYLLEAGMKKLRSIPGNLGAQILRRQDGNAIEFIVLSYWESRDAIKRFAGEDIEKPHHLPKDPAYLIELPTRVLHYDVPFSDLKNIRP